MKLTPPLNSPTRPSPEFEKRARELLIKSYDENYPSWRRDMKWRSDLKKAHKATLGDTVYTDEKISGRYFLPLVFNNDQNLRFGVYVGWLAAVPDDRNPSEIRPSETLTKEILDAGHPRLADHGFRSFTHQADGVMVTQLEFIAKEIQVSPAFSSLASEFCTSAFNYANRQVPHATLSKTACNLFEKHGVDYNKHEYDETSGSVRWGQLSGSFVEGCYPLSLTESNVKFIAGPRHSVSDLIAPFSAEDPIVKMARFYIIADNSD